MFLYNINRQKAFRLFWFSKVPDHAQPVFWDMAPLSMARGCHTWGFHMYIHLSINPQYLWRKADFLEFILYLDLVLSQLLIYNRIIPRRPRPIRRATTIMVYSDFWSHTGAEVSENFKKRVSHHYLEIKESSFSKYLGWTPPS